MANSTSLRVAQLSIKKFRCFKATTLQFDKNIILIEGCNGAGKTTLLEALHYACYLRSFRTHLTRELIQKGGEEFFIGLTVEQTIDAVPFYHDIQVGFSKGKRLVKIDKKPVYSYKDLLSRYRVISITEDDLELIKGAPETRRAFLDQALMLADNQYNNAIRTLRTVCANRNTLLRSDRPNRQMYDILTKQLWEISCQIAGKRAAFLEASTKEVQSLLSAIPECQDLHLGFTYRPKRFLEESYEAFQAAHPALFEQERRMYRSLFGAQLDDFVSLFENKYSKQFASRGQQKFLLFLLRIAHVRQLAAQGHQVVLLIDDFMTDFDQGRMQLLLSLLHELGVQQIFTTPTTDTPLHRVLDLDSTQRISI